MAAVEQKNDVGLVSRPVPPTSREELILTAVKFLQNPKVNASPYAQRKSFLLRKGLTEAEVEEAVRRSGGTTEDHVASSVVTPGQNTVAVNMPMAVTESVPSVSIWVKLRDFFNAGLFITGAVYALYLFYKKYIVRWWFGVSAHDTATAKSSIVAIDDLRGSVASVASAVTELKELVSRTNEQLDGLTRSHAPNKGAGESSSMNTTEIKDEIRSLKSLLLSKNQFPPVPSGAPVLPSWQRYTGSARSITTPATISISKGDETVSTGMVMQTAKVAGVSEGVMNSLAETSVQSLMPTHAGLSLKDDAAFPKTTSTILSVDETRAVYEGLNGIMNEELNGDAFNEELYGNNDVYLESDKSLNNYRPTGNLSIGLDEVSLVERPDPCHETSGLSVNRVENGSNQELDESSAFKEESVLSVEHIGESLIGGQKTKVIVNDESL